MKSFPAMIERLRKSALARNTIWMIGGQGLRLVIQALYFIEIARSLGASNYGAFIGVVALVGIAYPFGALGSGNLLVKNVARDPSLFGAYWGRALAVTAGCSSVLLVLVLCASHFALPASIPLLLVLLVACADLVGLNIITVSGQAFQAFERLNWTATINALISAGRLAGALILIAIHPRPSALEWGYVYFSATTAVAIVASMLVWTKLGAPRFRWPHSAAEMREGFYFSSSLSAQTIYNDIDKTMLARLATLDATGIYGAAYRLIDVSFAPISALVYSAYPNFFRAGAKGITASFRYAKPLLLRAFGYSSCACLAILLGAGIVPHILGPEYARTTEALRWLAPLPMLRGLHYFLSDSLTGAGHQGLRTAIQAGVAAFNVLINLWIIPLYSWRGAAWSSIGSDALLVCGTAVAVFILSRRAKAVVAEAVATAEYS
ncbi:MAG TPA: oligosaccharide flippase family protein [Candidatus Baltobacteraceae bacterium]|nr:oligosaccharide flippase family protein [Candidatus Baltobacteraceae bacterium]